MMPQDHSSVEPTLVKDCPDGLLPDGKICPRCGGQRAPSGVGGGTWVHFEQQMPEEVLDLNLMARGAEISIQAFLAVGRCPPQPYYDLLKLIKAYRALVAR